MLEAAIAYLMFSYLAILDYLYAILVEGDRYRLASDLCFLDYTLLTLATSWPMSGCLTCQNILFFFCDTMYLWFNH
jgi:hypothetical protein